MQQIVALYEDIPHSHQKVEKFSIADGDYSGLWSGHEIVFSVNSNIYTIHTAIGVKGINYPVTITIKNGEPIFDLE